MTVKTLDVEDTLSKLGQMDKILLLSGSDFWHTHPVEKLGIPKLRVSDGPNGIRGIKFFDGVPSNCFPCATGLGATWDVSLLEELGKQMGEECRAKGAHVWLGPTLNIQRSPLGGRGFESFSEDPVLSGKLSASIIRGCQSKGVAATPKHFVCNDQEFERNSNSSDLTMRAMREIYLRAFQIAIREGDPWCIMTAYNRINGLHVSENPLIMRNILREEWGWDGMAMSDWYGTYSTIEALKAGLDLEMPGGPIFRGNTMSRSLGSGKLKSSDLDESVSRVLKLANKAIESGIPFDKPEESTDTPEVRALLKRAAAAAVVLIKNEQDILPLSTSKPKKLAVIGPAAKLANISGGGSASLKPSYSVTPYEAIEQLAKKHSIEITYSLGGNAHRYLPLVDRFVESPDGKKGSLLMEYYLEDPKSKDAKPIASQTADTALAFLVDGVPKGVPERFYLQVNALFCPDEDGEWEFGLGVGGQADLFIDDKLVVDNSTKQTGGDLFFASGTVEETGKISLSKGKKYKLRVEFSNFKPVKADAPLIGRGGYRLGAARVIDAEQAIKDAEAVAKAADAVVLLAGLNADFESEGFDRPHMKLPPGIDSLIERVLQANANSVVVVQSGTQCEMPWYNQAKAVVQAFYGGNETGSGIASVLFGEHNPSAKLPLSFPLQLEDVPSHPFFPGTNGNSLYNEDVFVAYRSYVSKKPETPVLAAFGHGLSYTSFEISEPTVKVTEEDAKAKKLAATVEVTVKNTGKVAGAEVVQVYLSSTKSSLPRPALELAGFGKIHLEPGKSGKVVINLTRDLFSYWDDAQACGKATGSWVVEAADYIVRVGNSSANLPYARTITVKERFTWLGL